MKWFNTEKRNWINDFEKGKIAVVCDIKDTSRMFAGRPVHRDEKSACIGNYVGIGQKFIGSNEKSSADSTAESASFPWFSVAGDLCSGLDSNNSAVVVLCCCLLLSCGG